MPRRQLPTDAAGKPKPQAQRNFTDPDSYILKGGDGWIQGYNGQAAVDGDHQVIGGHDMTAISQLGDVRLSLQPSAQSTTGS